jgi:hypothetical protein
MEISSLLYHNNILCNNGKKSYKNFLEVTMTRVQGQGLLPQAKLYIFYQTNDLAVNKLREMLKHKISNPILIIVYEVFW